MSDESTNQVKQLMEGVVYRYRQLELLRKRFPSVHLQIGSMQRLEAWEIGIERVNSKRHLKPIFPGFVRHHLVHLPGVDICQAHFHSRDDIVAKIFDDAFYCPILRLGIGEECNG